MSDDVKNDKLKVAFFFGAGAEAPYGLPSGGEFALEIFRTIGTQDKQALRDEIARVEPTSHQALWLPQGYMNNRVTVFGKTNFDSIIASTLEMRRSEVIRALLKFDEASNKAKSQFCELGIKIDDVLSGLGCEPGTVQYSNEIRLNKNLGLENLDGFFGSAYFSTLVHLLRNAGFDDENVGDASTLARSFVEILIGALGQDLVHSLNNGIFEAAPDDLPFLDDIGGIFNLDYRKVGLDALAFILSKKPFLARQSKLTKDLPPQYLAVEFYLRVAEILYSTVVDYQSLVDSHYRYLYQPKKEWAKFCKISTFLFTVHRYMSEHLGGVRRVDAYYEDLYAFSGIDIHAVGTSNYTNLISALEHDDVFFLNGSLSEFYDPYRNEIVDQSHESLKVPSLFTQSGTKPMISIKMSRRYIDFFDKCRDVDRMVVLGYGFNSDDGHINTLLRSLIDDCGKKIDVIGYGCENCTSRKKEIAANIRCSDVDKITVHRINKERTIDDQPWLNYLFG